MSPNVSLLPLVTQVEDIPGNTAELIAEGRLNTQVLHLTLLALGALSAEYVEACWPACDLSALLDDSAIARRVTLLSQDAAIQHMAVDLQCRQNINAAMSIMRTKLDSPECTTTTAKDIADLSIKQASQMPRADAPVRKLVNALYEVTVQTVLGRVRIQTKGKPAVEETIRAMRCMDQAEVSAVVDALRSLGTLELKGW